MARNGFFLVVALVAAGLSEPLPSLPGSEACDCNGIVRFPLRALYSLIMESNSFCVVIRNTCRFVSCSYANLKVSFIIIFKYRVTMLVRGKILFFVGFPLFVPLPAQF